MPFLTFSNVNMQFVEKEHKQKSYTTAEVLPTTKRVELINTREFAAIGLDDNAKTFVIYVATLSTTPVMQVYPFCQAQVDLLLANKASTKVSSKYLDYVDVFSFNHVMELLENTSMNEHIIDLVKGKQPSYRLIHSLGLVELETLKIYIKTHLKNRFI